jgi:hypothetical protein
MSDTIIIPEYVRSGGFVPTAEELARIQNALAAVPSESRGFDAGVVIAPSTEPTNLIAVNDHLIPMAVSPDAISQEEKEMASTTALWIQHVTIGLCKDRGWKPEKIADPVVRDSKEYWDICLEAITRYTGWVVLVRAIDTRYHDETHKGQIDISGAVRTILEVVASEESAKQLAYVAEKLRGPVSVGVRDVATFWWNCSSPTHSASQFTMSPPVKKEAWVEYYYLFTYENIRQDDWRALFVESHYEEFTLSVVCQTLGLYLDQWKKVKDDVIKKLDKWIHDQIHDAPIG